MSTYYPYETSNRLVGLELSWICYWVFYSILYLLLGILIN